MTIFDTSKFPPMRRARLDEQLDTLKRFSDGGTRTVRAELLRLAAAGPLVRSIGDGMIDYNRIHFNRLQSVKAQREYEARLKAKRHYYINDWQVPKIVFDAIPGDIVRTGDAVNDPE